MIDYKPVGISNIGKYYANLINQLKVAVNQDRSGHLDAGVILLYINALWTSPELGVSSIS